MRNYDHDKRVQWLGLAQRLVVLLNEADCDLDAFRQATRDKEFVNEVVQKVHTFIPTVGLSDENLVRLADDALGYRHYFPSFPKLVEPYILTGQIVKDLPVDLQKLVACRYGKRDTPLHWHGVADDMHVFRQDIGDYANQLYRAVRTGLGAYNIKQQLDSARKAGDVEEIQNVPEWLDNQRITGLLRRVAMIVYVNELRTLTEDDLLDVWGLGTKSIDLIKTMLEKRGYQLRQE
jgi:hypothetical protein